MSIKNKIKRLQGILSRNSGGNMTTFIIPNFRDTRKTEQIQNQLMEDHDLNKGNSLVVFVIDYAMVA